MGLPVDPVSDATSLQRPRNRIASLSVVAVLLFAGLALSVQTTADPDGGLSWSNETGPAGGPVGAITGTSDVLVAGTWQLGTYVSHDNGNLWEEVDDFPAITEVHDAAWSPHNPDLGFVSGFGGLARTTDGGETWEHLIDDVTRTGPVAFHPDEEIVAVNYRPAGTFDLHIWISDDDGDTWEDLGRVDGGTNLNAIAFGPTRDHVYAIKSFGSYLTTDGGDTWTQFSEGGSSLAQQPDGTLWRAGFGPFSKSTDHGATWEEVEVEWNPRLIAGGPGVLFTAGNDGIRTSTDGGDTWTLLGFEEATFGLTDLFVDPNNPDAVYLTDENLGVVWLGPSGSAYALEGRTSGFPPVPVNTLGASADGSLLLAAGSLGTYGSRDDGETWQHLGPGMGMASTRAVAASADGEVVYSGGQTLFFWPWLASSQDGGRTWTYNDINIGGDGYVTGLDTHPDDPLTAWVAVWGELTESHVFETTDGGETWDAILVSSTTIHDVAYHPGSDSVLVATQSGVQTYGGLTQAWIPVSPGSGEARSVAAHGDHAFAGVNNAQIYRTPVGQLPLLTPWGSTEGAAKDVAPDLEGGAWLTLESGALTRCTASDDVLGLTGLCTDETPPDGGTQAALVRPDGASVFAASIENGLWTAQL